MNLKNAKKDGFPLSKQSPQKSCFVEGVDEEDYGAARCLITGSLLISAVKKSKKNSTQQKASF